MSARAASSALILSLLIAPGFFRPAQAGPWLPAPGEYYAELRGGLFAANTLPQRRRGPRSPSAASGRSARSSAPSSWAGRSA